MMKTLLFATSHPAEGFGLVLLILAVPTVICALIGAWFSHDPAEGAFVGGIIGAIAGVALIILGLIFG